MTDPTPASAASSAADRTTMSRPRANMRPRTPLDRAGVRLSVLVPVYNERDTIDLIVDQVRDTPIPLEIICVDDSSTDGTQQILETLLAQGRIDQLCRQPQN